MLVSSHPRTVRAAPSSSTLDDIERLRIVCVNERFAPELLPHEAELIKRLQDMVEEQVSVRTCHPAASGYCSRLTGDPARTGETDFRAQSRPVAVAPDL
jgi:hypothetical protein